MQSDTAPAVVMHGSVTSPSGKGENMKFNYSKLLGRIRECGLTQAQLANSIGINKGTMSAKLNGKFTFTTIEILGISEKLNIPRNEIGDYFFVA